MVTNLNVMKNVLATLLDISIVKRENVGCTYCYNCNSRGESVKKQLNAASKVYTALSVASSTIEFDNVFYRKATPYQNSLMHRYTHRCTLGFVVQAVGYQPTRCKLKCSLTSL